MIEMATKLRELCGLPAVIKKSFDQQLSEAKGANPAPEPLLTLSQWKALQETNKKEQSLPPTPVKPGLFTAACEKVRIITPRHLLQASPQQASVTTLVLTGHAAWGAGCYLLEPHECRHGRKTCVVEWLHCAY